jgi:uncharacterized protein YceK
MKKILAALMIAALLAGCTSSNEYGECIGAFDDKKAGVEYKLSIWNTAMAVIFVETVVVPVVVIANQARCPVGTAK